MGGLYHGRIMLHWCDSCHVPVLSKLCACGAVARPVPVTPPGDARPAFESDIEFVNSVYEENYGSPLIPEGHLALLNKVPDNDRMEEIVVGGAVVGAVRYLPEKGCWEPLPRPAAGNMMSPKKGYVVVDDGAIPFIRDKGSSVLAPGLVEISDGVEVGDELLILTKSGECIGVGRAKLDSKTARSTEKGQVVRTRKNIKSEYVAGEAKWEDAVSANRDVLSKAEAASVGFIHNVVDKNPELKRTVSYSGGKDSLVTLLVVMKAIGKVPLLTIDTGLEFAETIENVKKTSEIYDLPVYLIRSEDLFWEGFEINGPPSVDDRWCCKLCKLWPVRDYIAENFGECLSFIGQRKYESFSRMKNPRVWRNSFVKNQLCAAPIHNWTALHVWLYIFQEKAVYNVLYEQRVDRVGCYMCPASDIGILEMIRQRFPETWDSWQKKLELWQKEHDLPDSWSAGGWRKKGIARGKNEKSRNN